jgi:hypothetical protein
MTIFFFFPDDYNAFYDWSIENHLDFWCQFWNFSNLIYSKHYEQVFIELLVKHKAEMNIASGSCI